MMSVKMATPGLLKLRLFWNKDYDVIIPVDDVNNKILSRDSSYTVDVFMWQKFCNCSISIKEVITTSILYGFVQKTTFSEQWFSFKLNNFGLARCKKFKFYISVAKGFKIKVRKFLGLIPTFVEVTLEKVQPPPPPRKKKSLTSSWLGLK